MPLISRLMPVPQVLKANHNKKLYLYAFYGATNGEPPLLIPNIFANERTGAPLPGPSLHPSPRRSDRHKNAAT